MVNRVMLRGLLAAAAFLSLLVGYIVYNIYYNNINFQNKKIIFNIERGQSSKLIAEKLVKNKILGDDSLFLLWSKLNRFSTKLKAGEYEIPSHVTLNELLKIFSQGRVIQHAFTIVEGWNIKQLFSSLQEDSNLKHEITTELFKKITSKWGVNESLEGLFFPDTYWYTKGTSDIEILRRSYKLMQSILQDAWQKRSPNIMLQSAYEALILGSIIEKESGKISEYPIISGVYDRRLRKKMRLQADPCVLYGIEGLKILTRKHLRHKTPYNTYLYHGLPPSPIALPSAAAIKAAVNPKAGQELYFVADGYGGHLFSETLNDHIQATKKYKENLRNIHH